MKENLCLSAALVLFFTQHTGALAGDTYEAWYDAVITVPKTPDMPAKVHTYFDGKNYYSKTVNAMGNKTSYIYPSSLDPTMAGYLKNLAATSLGKKTVKGKECEGYQFVDPVDKRQTTNWLDDTGHLYYQVVEKYTGTEGTYEQTRTTFTVNPKSCALPADPDVVSSH